MLICIGLVLWSIVCHRPKIRPTYLTER